MGNKKKKLLNRRKFIIISFLSLFACKKIDSFLEVDEQTVDISASRGKNNKVNLLKPEILIEESFLKDGMPASRIKIQDTMGNRKDVCDVEGSAWLIDKNDYNEWSLPANTIMACHCWWAGKGHVFALCEEGKYWKIEHANQGEALVLSKNLVKSEETGDSELSLSDILEHENAKEKSGDDLEYKLLFKKMMVVK